jgi:hypothetical protein
MVKTTDTWRAADRSLDCRSVIDLPASLFLGLDGAGNALFGSYSDIEAEGFGLGNEGFIDGQVMGFAGFDRHGATPRYGILPRNEQDG